MAIQVNGTTVIDNSRNLTNIASVDAATVTALGNAGVGGGATSLIQSPTSIGGSASTKTFSLSSSYDVIYLYVEGIQALSSTSAAYFSARAKDSSNNPITAGSSYVGGSSDSGRQSDRLNIAADTQVFGAYYNGSTWPGYFTMMMRIQGHNNTNMKTHFSGWTIGYRNLEGSWDTAFSINFAYMMRTTQVINSVYLFESNGNSIGNGTYSMYGVNL